MGEVIKFIPDGDTFLIKENGWEKGTKVKGKWEGPYEMLYVHEEGTVYKKGNCKNNLLNGRAEESISLRTLEDGTGQETMTSSGQYVDGKKEGGFTEVTNNGETTWAVVWYVNDKAVQTDHIG